MDIHASILNEDIEAATASDLQCLFYSRYIEQYIFQVHATIAYCLFLYEKVHNKVSTFLFERFCIFSLNQAEK